MKVFPFKISKPENEALVYQEDHDVLFYNRLHQHEEIQISYIKNGDGTLVIGDSVTNYTTGDIIVIGSNLPHVFNSDTKNGVKSVMISLFFTRTSFGTDFFDLNEFSSLESFFDKSSYGFKVVSNESEISKLFLSLNSLSKLERFIHFFKIIQLINQSKTQLISSFVYQKNYSDNEGKRMRNVFDYTMRNFSQNINLDTIASVANMTTNAFCKYFKQRTNKTYFQLLNEIRIEHASRLLSKEKDLTIAEIAHESGFQNISNFNRKFKMVKQTTPSKYKQKFK